MIKANELRKGNLIHYKGKVESVVGIDQDDYIIIDNDYYDDGIEHVKEDDGDPIPLTPEWLERCGLFENGSTYKGELKFKGCGHLTIEVIEKGSLGYFAPFNKSIEIKHLHQLQNLYFALTGEELNVKL